MFNLTKKSKYITHKEIEMFGSKIELNHSIKTKLYLKKNIHESGWIKNIYLFKGRTNISKRLVGTITNISLEDKLGYKIIKLELYNYSKKEKKGKDIYSTIITKDNKLIQQFCKLTPQLNYQRKNSVPPIFPEPI